MGLFGIGDGKVDLTLKSNTVSPGGMLEGTATFTLSKEIKAKGVIAILFAEETRENMNGQRSTRKVYENKQQLDTAKTYPQGQPLTYNFKFVVPQTNQNQAQGALGTIMKGMAMVGMGGITRWYVEVQLNVGLLENFSKKQEINIVTGQAPAGGVQM